MLPLTKPAPRLHSSRHLVTHVANFTGKYCYSFNPSKIRLLFHSCGWINRASNSALPPMVRSALPHSDRSSSPIAHILLRLPPRRRLWKTITGGRVARVDLVRGPGMGGSMCRYQLVPLPPGSTWSFYSSSCFSSSCFSSSVTSFKTHCLVTFLVALMLKGILGFQWSQMDANWFLY